MAVERLRLVGGPHDGKWVTVETDLAEIMLQLPEPVASDQVNDAGAVVQVFAVRYCRQPWHADGKVLPVFAVAGAGAAEVFQRLVDGYLAPPTPPADQLALSLSGGHAAAVLALMAIGSQAMLARSASWGAIEQSQFLLARGVAATIESWLNGQPAAPGN